GHFRNNWSRQAKRIQHLNARNDEFPTTDLIEYSRNIEMISSSRYAAEEPGSDTIILACKKQIENGKATRIKVTFSKLQRRNQ
ncbi:hypothetical protein X798_05109, partial [Onchocerca flexuosa]